ncbi:MAG TPA: hypothetical protein VNU66_08740 [Mycobacteriales bacterium]|nr:hypothetical protein [Mycobacteriales bacterium]
MLRQRLVPALALSAALAAGSLAAAGPAAGSSFPDTVPLPDASSPEGISGGPGTTFFAGSRNGLGIVRGDLRTGESAPLVTGEQVPVAIGMLHDPRSGLLWVAGGPSGTVYAFDGTTGATVYRAEVPSGFLNDVAITRDAVYVTDSAVAQLVVVPLGRGGRPAGDAAALPVTGDFVQPDGFGLNGVRDLPGGDLVVVSSSGGLFRVDPATGVATTLLDADAVPSGDGLERVGSTLYVVNMTPDAIGVVDLDALAVVGSLTDGDLERPTTTTSAAGALWTVNGKFDTPGATEFEVVRVAR